SATPSAICSGESTTLTVTGGSLGTGATWKWYSGSCGGTPMGLGGSIPVSPSSTTTYYVRAEGDCNTTSCAEVIVSIKTESSAPTGASATPSAVCPGESTTLTVTGGSLGTGAIWEWYSGSCGGTYVGSGTPISVSPTTATTYYVRAEGDCNTTSCAEVTVSIKTESDAPSRASATPSAICYGESNTLTVTGGSLGTGASWEWYSGSCGGTYVGSGSSISVSPTETTTYYVRAEGDCKTTSCSNPIIVTVYPKPQAPVIKNSEIYSNVISNLIFKATTSDVLWCEDSALNTICVGPDSVFHPNSISSENKYNFYAARRSSFGCLSESVVITAIFDQTKPEISNISQIKNPDYYQAGSDEIQINFEVTDNFGVDSLLIVYKPSTKNEIIPFEPVKLNGNKSDQRNQPFKSLLFNEDKVGVEWYAKLKDRAGNETITLPYYIYIYNSPDNPITLNSLIPGQGQRNYQIIAFPLNYNENIKSDLQKAFGSYNIKNWRMFKYRYNKSEDKDEFKEFNDPDFKLRIGEGYWLILKNKKELELTGGLQLSNGQPIIIELNEGWNIIGNPYPFIIEWDTIMSINGIPSSARKIKTYSYGFSDTDIIEPYTGVFWYSDDGKDLIMPLHKSTQTGNRISDPRKTNKFDEFDLSSWYLPMKIHNVSIVNNINGIGMHENAEEDMDQFDDFVLPQFMDFIDIIFPHPESRPSRFSKDIRPVSNEETWNFTVETNTPNEIARLEWDSARISNLPGNLVLQNTQNLVMVDMKTADSYEFHASNVNPFKILYGDRKYVERSILPENIFLGNPYPNPASDHVTIPVAIPDDGISYQIGLNIVDPIGNEIRNILNGPLNPGIYKINWDCKTNTGYPAPQGIYLCQITISGLYNNYSMIKRIILK
ncbi:MAG TPA: hypothetical protein VI583_07090, partial [Cyclobacteriaceae bacterium]|nr:hypothetical protein [Cyclobacteriaceae bacterium]